MSSENAQHMALSLFNKTFNQGVVLPGKENDRDIYRTIQISNLARATIRFVAKDSKSNILVLQNLLSDDEIQLYVNDPDQYRMLSSSQVELIDFVYSIAF